MSTDFTVGELRGYANTYGHGRIHKALLELADRIEADERAAKPRGFGIACTVTWTELFDAMTADGMSPPNKCGPATRRWIEQVVRDYLNHPPAQAAQVEMVRPWPKFVQDECLEVLRNMDTELSATGRVSNRIQQLINTIEWMPTAEPAVQGEAFQLRIAEVLFEEGCCQTETQITGLADRIAALAAQGQGEVVLIFDNVVEPERRQYLHRVEDARGRQIPLGDTPCGDGLTAIRLRATPASLGGDAGFATGSGTL